MTHQQHHNLLELILQLQGVINLNQEKLGASTICANTTSLTA